MVRNEKLNASKTALAIEGGLLIAIGMAAVIAPVTASIGAGLFVGLLLLCGGAVKLTRSLARRQAPGFGQGSFTGTFMCLAGAALLFVPNNSIAVLGLIAGAVFMIDGLWDLFVAIGGHASHSVWTLASGIASLAIAAMLVLGWPGTTPILLGVLLGIAFCFSGARRLAIALASDELEVEQSRALGQARERNA